MTRATAIVSSCVKEEPVIREYLIFDPGTHSSRLLARGWPQNESGEEGLGMGRPVEFLRKLVVVFAFQIQGADATPKQET